MWRKFLQTPNQLIKPYEDYCRLSKDKLKKFINNKGNKETSESDALEILPTPSRLFDESEVETKELKN